VCNAANEVAVAAFLDNKIRFTDIPAVIEHTLERAHIVEPTALSVVEQADAQARELASGFLADLHKPTIALQQV
jgi:1-deoxy-D-xylulose-5-phosphate reductoisomerase